MDHRRDFGNIDYPRHFALLGLNAAILLAIASSRSSPGPFSSIAIYGAAHSLALIFSLRVRGPAARQLTFVVAAVALSVLSLAVGFYGARLLAQLPGRLAACLLLGLTSAFGAVTYLKLIRFFWLANLSPRADRVVPILCASATLLVLFSGVYARLSAGLSFALAWWVSLSVGLRYYDQRPNARFFCRGKKSRKMRMDKQEAS